MDGEREPDGIDFRWQKLWFERHPDGALREYVESYVESGTERLAEARRRHEHHQKGLWVQTHMIDPHVTALRVWREHRLLPEELAPPKDLDVPAEQQRFI